jgi:hypothetical protein
MKTATGLNIVQRKVGNFTRVDVYTDKELEEITIWNKIQHFIDSL